MAIERKCSRERRNKIKLWGQVKGQDVSQISDVVARFSFRGVLGRLFPQGEFFTLHLYSRWVHSRCISSFKVSLHLFFGYIVGKFTMFCWDCMIWKVTRVFSIGFCGNR